MTASWNCLNPETKAVAEELLTDRQLEVFKLWMAGAGHKRIALMLGISPSTARTHKERAIQQMAPYIISRENRHAA